MRRNLGSLVILLFTLLSAAAAKAQEVVVENPEGLPYSHDEALAAYRLARKHVAEELYPHQRFTIPDFSVILKLGCSDDPGGDFVETRYSNLKNARDYNGAIICLKSWNLRHFTYALIRIIESRLISESQRLALESMSFTACSSPLRCLLAH